MIKSRFHYAIAVLPLLLHFVCIESFAQSCPTDPAKIKSMIGELRDTFECSGLNFKSCNEYRGLVIGGAAAGVVVGGGLAAKTAAGVALMKSKAIVCPLPGTVASLPMSGAEFLAMLAFGTDADAKLPSMPGTGCSMDKKAATKIFDDLRRDAYADAKKISAEMKDRMLAEKLPLSDAQKLTEAERRQKMFSAALDKLQKEISTGGADAASKQSALEAISRARDTLASDSGSVVTRITEAYEKLNNTLPSQVRDGVSDATQQEIKFWNYSERIRAENAAVRISAAAKITSQVENDLEVLKGMYNNSAGREEFLKSKGYSAEFAKKLVAVDDARKTMSLTGSKFHGLVYEIGTSAKYKGVASISIEELRAMASRRVIDGYDWALRTFRELPGVNSSLGALVRRVGAEAIAKTATLAEGRLGTMVKYAAPVVTGVGKAMALPVQVGWEAISFTNDAHCGGERESAYAKKSMIEREDGKQGCHAIDLRTDKTDEFLYALSPSEQLAEVRGNPATCDLLARLYARYAPSQNWQVTCQGTVAQLNGKNTKGDGQMIRFEATSGIPQNIEWYSSSFQSCAKVTMVNDEVSSAQVFDTKTGMSSCGSVGSAKTVNQQMLRMRQNTSDEKQMVKQFAEWQDTNAYVMSAATDCCRTGENSGNPMCSNVSSNGRNNNGNRATKK